MTTTTGRVARGLRFCIACVVAIFVEVLLYLSYRAHDARFHWLTHFLVGASAAFLVMAVWSWIARRPARLPVVWLLLAHLYAMVPDLLFGAGVPHYSWMEVFLGHIASHSVPGRNATWLVVFAAALATYLFVLDLRVRSHV